MYDTCCKVDDFEIVVPIDITQSQKDKYCVRSLMCPQKDEISTDRLYGGAKAGGKHYLR